MRMLSSVAERLYWMSRYLERAEDTARLLNAYSHFILDIPRGAEPGWQTLVAVIDGQEQYEDNYKKYTERSVSRYLIADMGNFGSIRFSVKAARENVRTTRDVLPEQCWELVNELYLYVDEQAERATSRQARFEFLDRVVSMSTQINGLIDASLSRDHAYRFMRMGRLIERLDMTTRVVDVAALSVQNQINMNRDASLLWAHLLKSLSAVTAYRRHVSPLLEADEVVDFIFKNPHFPRSLYFCLSSVRRDSKGLKHQENVEKIALSMSRKLARFHASRLSLEELHRYIDKLQEQLNRLHLAVYQNWFSH